MKKKNKASKREPFDKYVYYLRAVQSPDTDVLFIRDRYRELRKRQPRLMREDFCGTFAICCEWVKLGRDYEAVGVDLDPEPIAWGMKNNLPYLQDEAQARVQILQHNVLDPDLPKVDVICAMNFSHYIFKKREQMIAYFKNCHATLKKDGIFLCDSFGGSQCQEENEEATAHSDFKYYWHQKSFDPVSNEALFYIHFKRNGENKREKVFTYDWRMWSIPELREMLIEAGFAKTHVYWEGTAKDGSGNGIYTRTEVGEECQAWIAYVVAEK